MNTQQIWKITAWMFILGTFICTSSCNGKEESPISQKDYPLFDGLNTYEMKISTNSELAQKYFNQGLLLFYGYNYPEAARSFKAAYLIDPNCAICYWGECLALCECADYRGDNWHRTAYQSYQGALKNKGNASEKEKTLIDAMAVKFKGRYNDDESPSTLFCDQMRDLYKKYPNDPDIAAFFTNSGVKTVDLFNGTRDDNPYGYAEVVLEAFEEPMKNNPKHPGLNHFYIHAMEAAGTPEKALEAAKNLDGVVPGSGHLEHMPAHIYFLYGMYHDATRTNQSGIDADDRMFAKGGLKNPEFAGFYLHNYYFLFDSLLMEGRSKEAYEASKKVVNKLKTGDLPSSSFLQDSYYGIPSIIIARTGMWDKLSEQKDIPDNLIYASAVNTYANGLAAVKKGDLGKAKEELSELQHEMFRYEKQGKIKSGPYSPALAKVLKIASLDLDGQIEGAEGNLDKQIENLNKAVAIEDTLNFHMLPWYIYMRHTLGDILLKANRPSEAEEVYVEDLKKHPHNGWSLFGLVKCLEMQNKQSEANKFKKEFAESWQYADLKLQSSHM